LMTFEAPREYGHFSAIHPEVRSTISVVDALATPLPA
jgi:hypothetical protein